MIIKNALGYENKEEKSEGDDNDWGNYTNCYIFARIVILFFLSLIVISSYFEFYLPFVQKQEGK